MKIENFKKFLLSVLNRRKCDLEMTIIITENQLPYLSLIQGIPEDHIESSNNLLSQKQLFLSILQFYIDQLTPSTSIINTIVNTTQSLHETFRQIEEIQSQIKAYFPQVNPNDQNSRMPDLLKFFKYIYYLFSIYLY